MPTFRWRLMRSSAIAARRLLVQVLTGSEADRHAAATKWCPSDERDRIVGSSPIATSTATMAITARGLLISSRLGSKDALVNSSEARAVVAMTSAPAAARPFP
jgi:hypothetical protein